MWGIDPTATTGRGCALTLPLTHCFSVDRIRRNGVLLRIWEGLGLSAEQYG